MAFWHSVAVECVASATAVSVYEPPIGTYVHVVLSFAGKCMVKGYVPSPRLVAVKANRTEADSCVSCTSRTPTRKKESNEEQSGTSSQIVPQTPGNAHGAGKPHFTDAFASPFAAHRPPIPEAPAMLNATTVAVASVTTVFAVLMASSLTKSPTNALKNGTCHRKGCSCRNGRGSRMRLHSALTPAETQLPRDRVSCPNRSMGAGHVCGKNVNLSLTVEVVDKRALGIGSSNMLSVMLLQAHSLQLLQAAATRKEQRNEGQAVQQRQDLQLLQAGQVDQAVGQRAIQQVLA